MSRKTRRSRRGPALVLVALVAIGAFVLWTRAGDTAPAAAGTTAATPTTGSAPSEPAPWAPPPWEDAEETAEEAGEEATGTPSEPEPTAVPEDDATDGGLAPVAVALTYTGYDAGAGAVVAGGYADGVAEEDATCTLLLRRNGVELYGESLGTPNVATTDCGEVRVGGDALTSGTWEAVLSYTSDTSVGESAVGEVVVP